MSRRPLLPGEPGGFPEDQIGTPAPPSRSETAKSGHLRYPHEVSVVDSYRETVLRIWPEGDQGVPIDLVPEPGHGHADGPEAVFGSDSGAVYFLSGEQAFGRLTTPEDNEATLGGLNWRLNFGGDSWCPAVASSPRRQWVEQGVILRGSTDEEATYKARSFGQDFVLRWDGTGLTPLASRPGVDVGGDDPVPVRLVPAKIGCPLRLGADGVCKMWGGPWTSSSMTAAYLWKTHRALLLAAFGCGVCGGEGGGGPVGAVDLFTPSRAGGWQFGAPRTRSELR